MSNEKKVQDRKVVPEEKEIKAQLEENRQKQEELNRKLRELLGKDDSVEGIPDDDFFEEFRRDLAQLIASEGREGEEE